MSDVCAQVPPQSADVSSYVACTFSDDGMRNSAVPRRVGANITAPLNRFANRGHGDAGYARCAMSKRSPHPLQTAAPSKPEKKRRGLVAGALFILWLAAVCVPLTYLTAFHTVPLPSVAAADVPQPTGDAAGKQGWHILHVLATDCGCSIRLAKYLLQRGKLPEVNETVWFIGGDDNLEGSLRRAGFAVECVDSERLSNEWGIQGVPWLLLQRPTGEVVYSGGYSERSAQSARDYEDVALLTAFRNGQTPSTRPAFGCATSKALRRAIDPLNLKGRPAPTR